LNVSGLLETRFGGKEIPSEEGLSSRRRSMYFAQHGEGSMQFLELFDGVNPCDGYKRTVSVLPQQALALVNNELVLNASKSFAAGGLELGESDFIRGAFTSILGRTPSAPELEASQRFLAQQIELLRGPKESRCEARARSNLVHVLFNHNDFVTIR
jgi:hypothetical protein